LPSDSRTTLKQFVAFGTIGVLGFAVDAGVLNVMLHLTHAGLYLGRIVSFLCAATFTWLLNRTITFQAASRQGMHYEWLRFLGANSLGGVLNFGVYSLLVAKFAAFAATPALGVAVGSLSGLLINFALSKGYVFRARPLA
jgi:putative flippase GtrA